MTNTTEFVKGEYYTIHTHSSESIFGAVLAVSAYGIKLSGYSNVPTRWIQFSSIKSARKVNISRLMNVYGK